MMSERPVKKRAVNLFVDAELLDEARRMRINDRGPFVRGRVIDLTPAGARALGFSGLAPVTLSVIGRG